MSQAAAFVFVTPQQAENAAQRLGCDGYHAVGGQGNFGPNGYRPCESPTQLLTVARAQRSGGRARVLPDNVVHDIGVFGDTLREDLTSGIRMTAPIVLGAWLGATMFGERMGAAYAALLGAALGGGAGGHLNAKLHPGTADPGSWPAHVSGMALAIAPAVVAWKRGTFEDRSSLVGPLGAGLGGLTLWAFSGGQG